MVHRCCNQSLECVLCHRQVPPDHECLMLFGEHGLLVVCCSECEDKYPRQRRAA